MQFLRCEKIELKQILLVLYPSHLQVNDKLNHKKMDKIYLFGNGNTSFEFFIEYYKPIIDKALANDFHFIVCDFRGLDVMVLEYLKDKTSNVTLLHCFDKPRYVPDKFKTFVSKWEIKGGFSCDKERDNFAISECSHFFAIDLNSNETRESGTLKNINTLKMLGKMSSVF